MRANRTRRAFGALLLAAATLWPAAVAATTASAAHYSPGTPVAGAVQQAYRGPSVSPSGTVNPATVTQFFHGGATDQTSGGTWDPTAPPSGLPDTQTASPTANDDQAGSALAAKWRGPADGIDAGRQLGIEWFWQSANPTNTLIRTDVQVTVFADPPAGVSVPLESSRIARTVVPLTITGAQPTRNVSVIPLTGRAATSILIQVVPMFIDTGQDVRVLYDSTTYPSGFGVATSPPAGSGGGAPVSTPAAYTGAPLTVQVTPVGRDAAEPTLGVNKAGTAFYAAGAFDALPVGSPTNAARTEVLRSRDGGVTWQSIQPTAPAGGTTLPPTTLDPYVYVEEDSGRVFNPELLVACTYLNYSDSGSEEISDNLNPAACGEYVNDHQTLVAGPRPAGSLLPAPSDPTFPEYLYYCFNRVADSDCGRSIDGGATFLPTATPAFTGVDPAAGGFCGGLHGHIQTDSAGRLFVPKGHCGNPWIAISADAGDTWKRVKVSQLSAASTHLAMAVDKADNLYFTWWDATDRLPYLAVSTDHGDTWGPARMIAPPGVREVNFPVVAAGDAGRIALNFPGTAVADRADLTRPWNGYLVTSTDALSADPLFVSTTINNPADPIHRGVCGPGRCAGMFDFLDVIVSPHDGSVWSSATDTCLPGNGCSTDPSKEADGAAGLAVRQLTGPVIAAVGGENPDVVIPEAPLTALLPVLALALGGGLLLRRRHGGT